VVPVAGEPSLQALAPPCTWPHAVSCGMRTHAPETATQRCRAGTLHKKASALRTAWVTIGDSGRRETSAVIYFEDLKIGERSLVGTQVVSKEEAIEFARKGEPQPYHLDEAAAETSLYGGLTVCSLYLFAVCTQLFFQREDQIAVTAMLGKDEVRLPKPARPGDSLAYYTELGGKRAAA